MHDWTNASHGGFGYNVSTSNVMLAYTCTSIDKLVTNICISILKYYIISIQGFKNISYTNELSSPVVLNGRDVRLLYLCTSLEPRILPLFQLSPPTKLFLHKSLFQSFLKLFGKSLFQLSRKLSLRRSLERQLRFPYPIWATATPQQMARTVKTVMGYIFFVLWSKIDNGWKHHSS